MHVIHSRIVGIISYCVHCAVYSVQMTNMWDTTAVSLIKMNSDDWGKGVGIQPQYIVRQTDHWVLLLGRYVTSPGFFDGKGETVSR